MNKTIKLLIYINILGLFALKCQQENHESGISDSSYPAGTNKIKTRFEPPDGFVRVVYDPLSFAGYLQNLELKPKGAPVYCFDGHEKTNKVYAAVIEMDIGSKDLQQCADAVMRLRAEYLFKTGNFKDIHILINPNNNKFSPWYSLQKNQKLITPEWIFETGNLKSFY